MSVSEQTIRQALSAIIDPQTGQDIVTAGLARAVHVDDGRVQFVLEIGDRDPKAMEPVRADAERSVRNLAGVLAVSAAMTAPAKPKAPPPNLKIGRHPTPERAGPQPLPGIDHVIAIASGKGGVGKSTLTANLAVALAQEGRRVGLLDADVYGPSQPRMMGINRRPGAGPEGKTIIPVQNHGVTMMSLGLMTKEGEAVVWRGPMLMGALQQMLGQVEWGELDVLLVDLPPGTGDVQLTLAQKAKLDGAIVISTPQDIALLDARKGIDMFNKTNTPVLGLIENMSTHVCSNCGHEEHLFGHGGVAKEAAALGVPLLAEIPLHIDIRLAADGGVPVVLDKPESVASKAYRAVARQLVANGLA